MDLKKYFSKFTFDYVLYMASSFMPPLSGFILLPVYSNYFTKEEYGILNLILLVSTVFSTIFYFGVNSSFSRLYHNNKNRSEKKSFYSTSYLLILIGFISQIVIGYIFSKYLSFLVFETNAYNDLLFISIIGQGTCFVNTLKMNYFRVNGNVIKFFIFSIFNFSISLVSTFLLFKYYEISISVPIYTILIVNILLFIILLVLNSNNLSIHSVSFPEVKRIFLFGFPFVLSSIFIMLGEWGDKVIISKFLSTSELADFSMVIKISSLYTFIVALPFSLIWHPLILPILKHDKKDFILNAVFTIFCCVSFSFLVGFTLFILPLLSVLNFNSQYFDIIKYCPFILLGNIFVSSLEFFSIGLMYSSRKNLLPLLHLLSGIINILISFFIVSYGLIYLVISYPVVRLISVLIIYKFGSFHTNSFRINNVIALSSTFVIIIIFISYLEIFSYNFQLNLLFEFTLFLFFILYSIKMCIPLIVYLNQQNNFLKLK